MTPLPAIGIAPFDIVLWLAAGAALGTAYFALLHHCVARQAAGGGALPLVALHLGRLAGGVAAFWALAQAGPLPLLLGLAGFLAARFVILRRVKGSIT